MKLFNDLISTDYGLMSLGVIVGTIIMGIWFRRFFLAKMAEDAARAGK